MNQSVFEELMYRSGLTAQGCWDQMDQYNRDAIIRFAQLIVDESCVVLDKWRGEPFPFDEDVAQSLIRDHFGVTRNNATATVK